MNVRASRIISALAISLLMVTSLVAQTSTSGLNRGEGFRQGRRSATRRDDRPSFAATPGREERRGLRQHGHGCNFPVTKR